MLAQRGRIQEITLFMAGVVSAGVQFHYAAPVFHTPPVFLTALSALIRPAAAIGPILTILTMAVYGFHAALLPRLSEVFFHCRRPGLWAALALIWIPMSRFFPQPEGIFSAVGLMQFYLMTDRRLARGGAGGALFTGLFAGLLALWNPLCMTVCALWLVYLASRRRVAFAAQAIPLIGLAFLTALAPWIGSRQYQFLLAWQPEVPIVLLTVATFLCCVTLVRRRTAIATILAPLAIVLPLFYQRSSVLWISLLCTGYLASSAAAALYRRPAASLDDIIPPLHLLK